MHLYQALAMLHWRKLFIFSPIILYGRIPLDHSIMKQKENQDFFINIGSEQYTVAAETNNQTSAKL